MLKDFKFNEQRWDLEHWNIRNIEGAGDLLGISSSPTGTYAACTYYIPHNTYLL